MLKEKAAAVADRYEFKICVDLTKSHRVSESKESKQKPTGFEKECRYHEQYWCGEAPSKSVP